MKTVLLITSGFILKSILVCLGLFVAACSDQGESRQPEAKVSPSVKSVKVSSVRATSLRGRIEYVGAISAHLKVNVSTEIGGTIEKLFFERGDRVKENQPLAEISTSSIRLEVQQAKAALSVAASNLRKTQKGSRPEEIRIAEATVEQAEATLRETKNNFKRIKDLHGFNAVANSEYDSSKRAVDTARARVHSSREQLELAKQGPRREDRDASRAMYQQSETALALAEDRLRKSRILSPCMGIIAFRKVEVGEVLGRGTVITQVVDNSKMKITLSLAEKDIPLLSKETQYHFTVDAIPGVEYTSRLSFLSPTADPITRSFPLELLIESPDSRMADGMTVRVKFSFANQEKFIRIPSAWLWEEDGRLGIFVVEKGKALFRSTRLGSYYGHKVQILEGLEEGDLVITNPAGLRSGDEIQQEFGTTQ